MVGGSGQAAAGSDGSTAGRRLVQASRFRSGKSQLDSVRQAACGRSCPAGAARGKVSSPQIALITRMTQQPTIASVRNAVPRQFEIPRFLQSKGVRRPEPDSTVDAPAIDHRVQIGIAGQGQIRARTGALEPPPPDRVSQRPTDGVDGAVVGGRAGDRAVAGNVAVRIHRHRVGQQHATFNRNIAVRYLQHDDCDRTPHGRCPPSDRVMDCRVPDAVTAGFSASSSNEAFWPCCSRRETIPSGEEARDEGIGSFEQGAVADAIFGRVVEGSAIRRRADQPDVAPSIRLPVGSLPSAPVNLAIGIGVLA